MSYKIEMQILKKYSYEGIFWKIHQMDSAWIKGK